MRLWGKGGLACLLALALLFVSAGWGARSAEATPAAGVDYDAIIASEAAWIADLQLPSGAIPTYSAPIGNYNGKYRIIPYFANIACLGLLEASSDYWINVKKYMDWYFGHLNASDINGLSGTVYDYDAETDRTTETPLNTYDSTDSYAATFLSLLRKYAEVTGDTAYLTDHAAQIGEIGGAIVGTLQADGLTFAKPDYRIKYLMDNSEVHEGLADAVWIYRDVLADDAEAGVYEDYLSGVGEGIAGLWDEGNGLYRQYKDEAGNLGGTQLANFYPDATAQLFPIWEKVIPASGDRALALYNKFNANHPGWPVLSTQDSFPWAIIAYTAAAMGDKTRVDTFLSSVKSTYIDQGHPWPWYCMEAGMTMMAAKQAKSLASVDRGIAIDVPEGGGGLTATELPVVLSGTSQGIDKVEIVLELQLTHETETAEVDDLPDGTWSYSLPDLLNGVYTVTAKAKDKYDNVYEEASVELSVDLASGGERLTEVTLTSDKYTLRRSETAQLSLTGKVYDGSGYADADLSDATVVYQSDRPDLIAVAPDGTLTLKMLDRTIDHIQVWANVTLNRVPVQSAPIEIRLDPSPLTLYDSVLDAEAQRIADSQLPSGAIPTGKSGTKHIIDAHDANIAALGLLERPEYAAQARKYIDWYAAKFFAGLNWPDRYGVYGTAYDYEVDESDLSAETSLDDYASAPATIATFISLLRKYEETTGEMPISQYQLDIMTGGLGLLQTQDAGDGLLRVKPGDAAKRLTDNAEAYAGLRDAVWLFRNAFEAEGPAAWYESFETGLAAAIDARLWDEEAGAYILSLDAEGVPAVAQRTTAADAASELTAVASGIAGADGERASAAYADFNRHFAGWTGLSVASDVYLPVVAYAGALAGDKTRVAAFLQNVQAQYIEGSHPADWYAPQAGLTMLAAAAAQKLADPPPPYVPPAAPPEDGAVEPTAPQDDSADGSAGGTIASAVAAVTAAAQALAGEKDPSAALDLAVAAIGRQQANLERFAASGVPVADLEKALKRLAEAAIAKLGVRDVDAAGLADDPSALNEQMRAIVSSAVKLNEALRASGSDAAVEPTLTLRTSAAAAVTADAANRRELTLPGSLLQDAAAAGIAKIKWSSDVASVTVSPAAFGPLTADAVTLTASVLQGGSEDAGRLVELTAVSDGREVASFSEPVKVEVPYAVDDDEDPGKLAIYCSYDGGTPIQRVGKYDAGAGTTAFKTDRPGACAVQLSDVTFADLTGYDWAKDSLEAMAAQGIVRGVGTNRFEPSARVTRAQFAAMIVRALELQPGTNAPVFADVKADAWYADAVAAAAAAGLVNGKGDGTFDPDAPISRQEMAAIVANALEKFVGKSSLASGDAYLSGLADRSAIAAYAEEAVSLNIRYGIMQGVGGGAFAPQDFATRAQAVVMIDRLLGIE